MSTFKIKLKFELEVEGTRDDVPLITQSVGSQIAGMLTAPNDIVEGQIVSGESQPQAQLIENGQRKNGKKRPTSKRQKAQSPPQNAGKSEISWNHDPAHWGTPNQDWTTVDKAIWLLYVVAHETEFKELTGSQITDTFNAKFRQARTIQTGVTNRDLAKQNRTVGKTTTRPPHVWFLTKEGEKRALELIVIAGGETGGS
jgi:hypothetical protein